MFKFELFKSGVENWDDFVRTRACKELCKQVEQRIRKIDDKTLSLSTFDGFYHLQLIKVSVQGWANGYRTDDPYASNYSRYSSFSNSKDAIRHFVEAIVRYQYEVEEYGRPSVSWNSWARENYVGLQKRLA